MKLHLGKHSPTLASLLGIAVALSAAANVEAKDKIGVTIAGDSLATNSETPWPTVLAKLLGDEYEVKVFAANGLSVLRNTYRSIWTRYELANSLKSEPQIFLVCFGANDAKSGNWARKREFIAEYKRIIGMIQELGTKPKIYMCLPPPATTESPYGIVREILHNQLVPTMKEIAKETGVTVIDTHSPLKDRADATLPDGLYPTPAGHEIIGRVVYNALSGKNAELPAAPKEPTPEDKAKQQAALAVKAPHVKPMNVGDVAELTAAIVADPRGDGPDGVGNTEDDTWQFWFELAHARKTYHRLDLATATMTPEQREQGIFDPKSRPGHQKKVTGPIASGLPNPKDTEGYIFRSDWNGKFEGVWGDKKANQVLMHPYVEKTTHGCVAVSFRVPADGEYDIAGKVTDLQVIPAPKHTGILWSVEIAREQSGAESPKADRVPGKGGPVGDKVGPDSQDFDLKNLVCKKGELIRLVIDPNEWWGTDLTKVDYFRIKRVK